MRPSDAVEVPAPSRSGEQRSPRTQVCPPREELVPEASTARRKAGGGGRVLVLPVLCAQHYTSVWTETRGQWKGRTKANHASFS